MFSLFSMFFQLTPYSPIRDSRMTKLVEPWTWQRHQKQKENTPQRMYFLYFDNLFFSQPKCLIFVNFGTPPHYLALWKHTKKCASLQQNSPNGQNRPKFRFLCAKRVLAWKSIPSVEAVVTIISSVYQYHLSPLWSPLLIALSKIIADELLEQESLWLLLQSLLHNKQHCCATISFWTISLMVLNFAERVSGYYCRWASSPDWLLTKRNDQS